MSPRPHTAEQCQGGRGCTEPPIICIIGKFRRGVFQVQPRATLEGAPSGDRKGFHNEILLLRPNSRRAARIGACSRMRSRGKTPRLLKYMRREKGVILVWTFIIMVTLTAIVSAFLYANAIMTKSIGWDVPTSQALWLAEAGLQKAVYYLKTPSLAGPCFSVSNPSGNNWTAAGCTENLGAGNYTMVVVRWDFALAANGSTASANSSSGANVPSRAIDGNAATFWESGSNPSVGNPQFITVQYPYTLTINKAFFLQSSNNTRPRDYTWQVSTDGAAFTTVFTGTNVGSSATGVTDTFTAQSNVNYLRLRVTRAGAAGTHVRVVTLGGLTGSKITSTGTANTMARQISQTAVANSSNGTAANEIDWAEA